MADLIVKRVIGRAGTGFVPADRGSEIEAEKLPLNARLRAKITRPRNRKHNGLMFGPFFTTLAAILNDGPSERQWDQDKVRKRLLAVTGHADVYPAPKAMRELYDLPEGACCIEPKSMAFDSMDQNEASAFYGAALDYVLSEFGDWCQQHPLWPTIEGLIEPKESVKMPRPEGAST